MSNVAPNFQIYANYTNVNNPERVHRAFKYYHLYLYYSYIKRNNWTGLGPRKGKLKIIVERALRLANYNAAKAAGTGNYYKLMEGTLQGKNMLFLEIYLQND